MKWSYGITTCPERFNNLLPKTVESLAEAGFHHPVIFADGDTDWEDMEALSWQGDVAVRSAKLKHYGNWILAAWELWIREPNAQRYAIFQDDIVACKGLKTYLEQNPCPPDGYMNLYTFPENQKHMSEKIGWYHAQGGMGLGGLGLVFTNPGMAALLQQKNLVMKPQDPHNGTRKLDGASFEAMNRAGFKEYVHNPSLLQHAGVKSSTFGDKKNRYYPLAPSFKAGDINELAKGPKVLLGKRIGFVGYHCEGVETELNLQLCRNIDVDTWMIKVHPRYNIKYPTPDFCDTTACRNGTDRKIEEFLRKVDVVIFCNHTPYQNLVRLAKKHGKKVVCCLHSGYVPKENGWEEGVDLWWTTNEVNSRLAVELGLDPYAAPIPADKESGKQITEVIRKLTISA